MIPLVPDVAASNVSDKEKLEELVRKKAELLAKGEKVPPSITRNINKLQNQINARTRPPRPARGPGKVKKPQPVGEETPGAIPASVLRAPIDTSSVDDVNQTHTQAGTGDDPTAGSTAKPLPSFKIDNVMVLNGLLLLGVFLYLNYGKK